MCASSVGRGRTLVSVLYSAVGTADKKEVGVATYSGSGPLLHDHPELLSGLCGARDMEESWDELKGQLKVGREGVGGS